MILIKTNQENTIVITVSQNAELPNPQWLFSFTHIFSKRTVRFVLPNVSTHKSRYDEFVFVEGQGANEIAFPFEGQYIYNVYEQVAQIPENLNPALAYNVVETGIATVIAMSASTTNDYYEEFISPNEFNANYIFAPNELNPPTPTPTETATNTPTPSITPTNTPTASITPSNTATPTETPVISPSPTTTSTNTPTPSITASRTPTRTPTQTPTNTKTETPTPTNTRTQTLTPTTTTTLTATPTQTASNTPTNTNTPTQTSSPTQTPTPSITASQTITPTNTSTPTQTPTNTITQTQSPTNTGTPSITSSPTNTNTQTSSPTPTPTRPASGTTEAQTYLSAVVDAGGTGITSTVSAATITLFTSLVSNGLYDKMLAFYPMLGGNSSGCKFNAKNPVDTNAGYRLVFNGGWTFNSSGATSNGTNAYAETYLSGASITTGNNHLSTYMLSDTVYTGTGKTYIGTNGPSSLGFSNYFSIGQEGSPYYWYGCKFDKSTNNNTVAPQPQGFNITTTTGTSFQNLYRNGVIKVSYGGAGSGTLTSSVVIGALNNNGAIQQYYDNTYAFATIGLGLGETQQATLSTIINTFQTTLSRNTY